MAKILLSEYVLIIREQINELCSKLELIEAYLSGVSHNIEKDYKKKENIIYAVKMFEKHKKT